MAACLLGTVLVLVIVILVTTVEFGESSQLLQPEEYRLSQDGRLTYSELAKKYGHPAEEKEVITADGYILKLFHTPGDKSRVVLLVHGNTPAADCWINRGNGSLAIALAEQNYDVWAISLRGTRYSRRHVFLDPDKDSRRFFNFSFYEQAIYDMPATIDFVLKETGQKDLLAIGHSVGTTQLYVLGAEKPEYNEKIKLAISLAPISYLQNLRGLILLGVEFYKLLDLVFRSTNTDELFDHDKAGSLIRFFCVRPNGYELCVQTILFGLLGRDEEGFEPDYVNTFFGHMPAGSSRKTFTHLGQIRERKKFAKFDYGVLENLALYGSREPPEFDLSKVTMKSALFVGREDFLATVADAELLNSSLPNVVHYQVMPYERFNHADFAWGRKMADNLFPYLLEIIEKYI